jgi:hypothetical protein
MESRILKGSTKESPAAMIRGGAEAKGGGNAPKQKTHCRYCTLITNLCPPDKALSIRVKPKYSMG